MANLKSIIDLPITESAEGVNLIVEDNGVAKRIAADAAGLGAGGTSDAVQYIEQALTEEQQMQARKNLGLYNEGIGKVDIVPEQQVTFVDGVATFPNFFDPCYDLDLVTDGGEAISATMEINSEVIEGEIYYHYVMNGTFGNYSIEYDRITLGEGASIQNGETVTIRIYVIGKVVNHIKEKYLPENVATAVSYTNNQGLTELQQLNARANIGVINSYKITIYSVPSIISSTEIRADGIICEMPYAYQYPDFLLITIASPVYSDKIAKVMVPFDPDCIKIWFEFLVEDADTPNRVQGYIVPNEETTFKIFMKDQPSNGYYRLYNIEGFYHEIKYLY